MASDPISRMIEEADAICIRSRMRNTGESEEQCRLVVMEIRSRVQVDAKNRRREYLQQWNAAKYLGAKA